MPWFWGKSDEKDVLRDLDPSLRDFLKKEAPAKYESPRPVPEENPLAPAPPSEESKTPAVPSKSLYQDGRYAHLWKTYKPIEDVEAAGKSSQEKTLDVLDGYKSRRAEIGRTALENCALEQLEVSDCFRNGGWSAKATMCRAENRRFDRCYMMQSKFLKALGYLSTDDRPPEENERIQMQADTLYHRMLDQEKAIEKAKEEGLPPPAFPPLLAPPKKRLDTSESASGRKDAEEISDLRERIQAPLKKQLGKLEGEERDLTETAMKAEIAAGAQVARRLEAIEKEKAEQRRIRKEQGQETLVDKVASLHSK
ncbi:hypothetical protein HYFRA_00012275 [Hymenoscyphus fraxineus]|uniref:Autophagy protein n=1 Tax=Hymenoscyphus fraxineus TaxID=746836 RepID=A0A9N9L156_9HELO|nr:hypothetical protein HYFRA_00012275 [Hymenoscyphus fraxineus]